MVHLAVPVLAGVRKRKGNAVQKITIFCSYLSSPPPPLPPPPQTQIFFESRLGMHDMLNNCTITVDGTDFRIPKRESRQRGMPLRPTSTRGSPPCVTNWGSTSSRGTLFGSRVHTLPVSIPTLKFLTRF